MKVVKIKETRPLPDKTEHAAVLDLAEEAVDRAIEQIQEEYGSDAVVARGNMMREIVEPFVGPARAEVTCSIQVIDVVVVARRDAT